MEDKKFVFPSETIKPEERSVVVSDDIVEKDDGISTPLFTPTSFQAGKDIVETLVNKKTVIVSIDKLTTSEEGLKTATRLIDFICGATQALHGKVSKINKYTFYFSVKKDI